MVPGDKIYSRGGEELHLKNQRTIKGKQLPSPFQIFLFCSYIPLAILSNNPENKWGICRLQPFGDRRDETKGQYPESAWRVINSNRGSYRESFSKSSFNHNSQDFCPSNEVKKPNSQWQDNSYGLNPPNFCFPHTSLVSEQLENKLFPCCPIVSVIYQWLHVFPENYK